jgi:hypothetical protein
MKFLIFLAFIASVQSLILECRFGDVWGFGYSCIVQNSQLITSKDDREISEVKGQHLSGKTNDDVKFFQAEVNVFYFPRNLTNFFKNLDKVWIHRAFLQEITKDDLNQFNNTLREIHLHVNQLKVIPSNLFENNENIEEITLSDNQIRHVESGAFDGLQKLRIIYFEENPCTNDYDYGYNHDQAFNTIRRVERKCKVRQ